MQTNVASIDWSGSRQASRVDSSSHVALHAHQPSRSFDATGTALDSAPSCRPWERGDLLRRLATYKPTTWASKPKATSSLACARRGWVNIDMDKIECESCGAHLIFSALTSWSLAEVANAGEAFAEQLDASHQNSCPWRGNSCADSLVQLHLTQSALIGGFKDRCDGLLQFTSLPVIASSATENMRLTRGTQIDRLLSQSITFLSGELSYKADSTPGIDIQQDSSCSYSQARKLISLCGWEPRWLPNVQDCEENSTHSAKNADSVEPFYPRFAEHHKISFSASAKKDKGKGKRPLKDSECSMRSPLLDCNFCGSTVKIWDFRSVPRPSRFSPNNIDAPEAGKKLALARGISAASGINEWLTDGMERDPAEGCDEEATNEGKSLSNAGVDLNLTMAGGLPSIQSSIPIASEHFNGGLGRDLMIGQPTGSEVGDHATSYESRGPSSRKRNHEEGGSTVDKPQDRLQYADSIEGTVIDRDGEEVDDAAQDSDIPNKKSRGFDLFGSYLPSSSGAGPSRNFCFDPDMDTTKFSHTRAAGLIAVENPSARYSMRESSVVAMDTVHSEDSMESVEYYPGDCNDIHMPSSSAHRNIEMNDALDLNYSNQAQQSVCVQLASGSDAREIGGSSTNEGEEVLNAETVPAFARDQLSVGISGGSVGMGASHEAEIHGIDVSVQRTESVVGDAEPTTELTETMGHTGESAPGRGLMDEFVPEEVDRQEPHGDSQDMVSQSVGQADSGSKIYGSTKADSVESGEKIGGHTVGHANRMHPSISCNAGMHTGFDASKEEVTQAGKVLTTDDAPMGLDYDPQNGLGATNGENDYDSGLPEFDPVKHHSTYCPWVNGIVAAACCSNTDASSSSSPLSGWQLTVDALDTFQSLGQAQNHAMQSDSAASLYMVKFDHLHPSFEFTSKIGSLRCKIIICIDPCHCNIWIGLEIPL
ncbi:hypothetical protein GUJ93_ZPchr0013g34870 [Zizania palustris]|uniref:C3HC-type domain-containing protein n=2 Tax=Zizania palustris TaxID=103762 RepID=A0A8J5WZW8_ZIZPA|nr:hypothetical protein GUJ93_ZPchr0013g34870 [Zizania palustris]